MFEKDDILDVAIRMLESDNMTKERIIEGIYGKEVKVTYQQSAQVWYHIVPAKVQKEYGLAKRINGATRKAVIDRIFDNLRGENKTKKTTLAGVYEAWISERRKDEDLARHTIRKNECDWESHFKNYPISQAPITSITPADLKEHFKTITANRCMRIKAFSSVKTLTNALWDYAYDHNMVASNISKGISKQGLKFKVKESSADKTYTAEERTLLCDYLLQSDNPLDLAIVMQFCLGCRVGEIKGLYWADCDVDREEITIRRDLVDDEGTTLLKPFTKSGKDEGCRTLPMTERAKRVLEKLICPADRDNFVFLWNGKPLKTQTINSHLKRACKVLNIRYLSSHKIRATVITESLAVGMDQASVMRIAGHSGPETMRHYVRVQRVNKDIKDKFNLVCG